MQCSDKKINMNKPIVDALKNLGNRRKIFIKNLKNLHDFFLIEYYSYWQYLLIDEAGG